MFTASWARRIGLDRNPLRRGTDRIEAAARLAMVILLLIGVPVAAIVVGRQADHAALRQAHAQQAAEHLIGAILLQQAPANGIPDPYTSYPDDMGPGPLAAARLAGPVRSSPGHSGDAQGKHRADVDRRLRESRRSAAGSPQHRR